MAARWSTVERGGRRAALGARRRPGSHGLPEAVLQLQRTAGNRAVCEILRCKDKKNKKNAGGAGSKEQQQLKAAKNQAKYEFGKLPDAVRHAITEILNDRGGPFLRPAKNNHPAGWHGTDPETGMAKAQNIGVREYHVSPSDESKRIVVRTQQKDKRVYYDPSHVGGTYTYHPVVDPPFPVAQPAPVQPAPAVQPVLPAVQQPVAAAVQPAADPIKLPTFEDWETAEF